MNAAKGDAAWVLPTPQAAQKITHAEFKAEKKRFATFQAKLALKGYALEKLTSSENGSTSDVVSNWGQSRVFSNWEDLSAFYILLGGRA